MKFHFHKFFLLIFISVFGSFVQSDSSLKEKYQPGYYIDQSGKVEGFIYFNYTNYEKFKFKKTLDGKASTKTVENCSGFYVEEKKFDLITKIDLKIGVWNVFAEKAFAEVVIEGPLSLYKIYSMVGNTSPNATRPIDITNYILKKNTSKLYHLAHPRPAKFKSELSDLLQNRVDIVEKIKNGTYTIDNISDLVNDYNNPKP